MSRPRRIVPGSGRTRFLLTLRQIGSLPTVIAVPVLDPAADRVPRRDAAGPGKEARTGQSNPPAQSTGPPARVGERGGPLHDDGERPAHRIIEGRSNRLGRGLVSIGVVPGDTVVVLCCDQHRTDQLVAYLGSEKAGAVPVVLPLLPPGPLGEQLRAHRPNRILACDEGVTAWRRTGVGCRVVGDAPDVTWWKLLEAQHSAAAFQVPFTPALPGPRAD